MIHIIKPKYPVLMVTAHKEILMQYFPGETVDQVSAFLVKYSIQLKITRTRVSKLGDYRAPVRYPKHRITINGNLEKYFLYLVFLHELAHLLVWNKYKGRVNPHGKQWKEEFSALLRQALFLDMLPAELRNPVYEFSKNVKATFASDPALYRVLKSLDQDQQQEITIEDIPEESYFVASNGRMFKKEEKLRKRYRCFCLNNNRRYLFHPMAVIQPVQHQDDPSNSSKHELSLMKFLSPR
jgi:SprT protein